MAKLSLLRQWFNEFNTKYFSDELAVIPIRITRSKRYWGHFSDPPAIYLGRHLNRTVEEFKETLLHEMIHQYVAQINLVEKDDHGPIFRQEYLRIIGKEYKDLE